MKAKIQESYILLTLFAALLYIANIKMCTQTKTIKEKRSNWAKQSVTGEKYWLLNIWLGRVNLFSPVTWEGSRKNMFWLRQDHCLISESWKILQWALIINNAQSLTAKNRQLTPFPLPVDECLEFMLIVPILIAEKSMELNEITLVVLYNIYL